jgi:hypothetical protein
MIYFDYLCQFPLQQLFIEATSDGSCIVLKTKSGEKVNITDLKLRDRLKIKELVGDWVQYYKDMQEMYKTEAPDETASRTVEA